MQVARQVGMTSLDLERAVAEGVGIAEELGELVVAQMEIEARGISAHAVAPAAEEAVKRQVHLLSGKVPQRNLQGYLERLAGPDPVTSARAIDAMDEGHRQLALQMRPDLCLEDAVELLECWQGAVPALHEAETASPLLIKQLDRSEVGVFDPDLAIADHAVASKLETRDLE